MVKLIVNLEDYDKSGKIDVNDFLDMTNEQILKENNGKKFDICLMNPPYGSVGGDTLHLKFIDKCLNIANKQIVIMTLGFVTKVNQKGMDVYKKKFDNYLIDVEEVDSKLFEGITMGNCGIYYFNNNKKEDKIKISRLNKENDLEVYSLLDISEFNDYESEIIKILNNNGMQEIYSSRGASSYESDEKFNRKIKKIKDACLNKKVFSSLVVNDVNGGLNGKFMSSKVGQIFTSYKDIETFFKQSKTSYNIFIFDSINGAYNCKIALKHPLLRFTLYRTQNNQHMNIQRCFKYIPAIDWSDDRVKTDEGLLEVCGCPKDKCKEYAEYCKKIIDEVDKK